MKIYVASKFEEYPRVREIMAALIEAGHTITYDWTNCDQFTVEQAAKDMDGVLSADALVFIAEENLPYKGAYVEFGIAVARGIPIYLLGNAANACIFTKLPQVQRGLGNLLTPVQ
jgi:nucleoside 2-deoxyribosyltransferase